jgi:hypothetical protein
VLRKRPTTVCQEILQLGLVPTRNDKVVEREEVATVSGPMPA